MPILGLKSSICTVWHFSRAQPSQFVRSRYEHASIWVPKACFQSKSTVVRTRFQPACLLHYQYRSLEGSFHWNKSWTCSTSLWRSTSRSLLSLFYSLGESAALGRTVSSELLIAFSAANALGAVSGGRAFKMVARSAAVKPAQGDVSATTDSAGVSFCISTYTLAMTYTIYHFPSSRRKMHRLIQSNHYGPSRSLLLILAQTRKGNNNRPG